MKGSELAALLIRFGPIAFDWLVELSGIWNKELTPEEVAVFCKGKRKALEGFEEAERLRRLPIPPPVV
jgi:hypothetical protein